MYEQPFINMHKYGNAIGNLKQKIMLFLAWNKQMYMQEWANYCIKS